MWADRRAGERASEVTVKKKQLKADEFVTQPVKIYLKSLDFKGN